MTVIGVVFPLVLKGDEEKVRKWYDRFVKLIDKYGCKALFTRDGYVQYGKVNYNVLGARGALKKIIALALIDGLEVRRTRAVWNYSKQCSIRRIFEEGEDLGDYWRIVNNSKTYTLDEVGFKNYAFTTTYNLKIRKCSSVFVHGRGYMRLCIGSRYMCIEAPEEPAVCVKRNLKPDAELQDYEFIAMRKFVQLIDQMLKGYYGEDVEEAAKYVKRIMAFQELVWR